MVVGSLRLKLVVVVVLVVVVDPEVGQSGLSGHSLVSVWLPLQGSPLPTASWTTNLDRVWVPPGPQDLLHRLQRLSSDHRQSTNVLRSKQSLSFKMYRQWRLGLQTFMKITAYTIKLNESSPLRPSLGPASAMGLRDPCSWYKPVQFD